MLGDQGRISPRRRERNVTRLNLAASRSNHSERRFLKTGGPRSISSVVAALDGLDSCLGRAAVKPTPRARKRHASARSPRKDAAKERSHARREDECPIAPPHSHTPCIANESPGPPSAQGATIAHRVQSHPRQERGAYEVRRTPPRAASRLRSRAFRGRASLRQG